MSLFTKSNVICPACQTEQPMDIVGSVNADRRPDLRDDIITGRFQRHTCSSCDVVFRLDPQFTFLDVGRQLWIAGYPAWEIGNWKANVELAAAMYATAYGAHSGPVAQDIGASLTQRVTFGWPALREKIVLFEAGYDDSILELAKIALIRNGAGDALASGVELRFVENKGPEMVFCWIDAAEERVVDQFSLPRQYYDDIAQDAAAWGELGESIAAQPFVDMQKMLYTTPEPAAPAAPVEPAL